MPKVAQLFRYPVKSCRAQLVDALEFDAYGPAGDRRWLITTPDYEDIVTQRKFPKLNQLSVEILSAERVTVSTPESPPLTIAYAATNTLVKANVWKNYFQARDAGETAARFLSDFLETPVRLVGLDPEFSRKVKNHPDDQVAFADAYPVLIISQASLDWLNDKLEQPVSMHRFRPNIVVDSCDAFEEDQWKRITIGSVTLKATGPCARCIMTTVDPDKASFDGPEPLKTLAKLRRSENGILFGQNYLNESKTGKISLGDGVQILKNSP